MTVSVVESRKRDRRKAKIRALATFKSDPKTLAAMSDGQKLDAARILVEECNLSNYTHVLPLIFNWDGRPYSLQDHFPMEPLFNSILTDSLCVMSGRQISKSTTQASRGLMLATSIPNFTILYMFPLHEQVSKFSNLYVKKFIDESPLKQYWSGTSTSNNVLLRSFKNHSKMLFSFASLSASRVRGSSANLFALDEADDMDPAHIPIIKEALSASKVYDKKLKKHRYADFSVYTGTPKTKDGFLYRTWQDSSQAEWAIPCVCGKLNYPTLDLDLDRMVGPYHEDIGEVRDGKKPAVICASSQCGRAVNPRDGFWHHKHPDRVMSYPGYHIPQIIMPMHYAEPRKWAKLLGKRAGAENYSTAKYYNEVMGEAYDIGAKLVTESDIKKACQLKWRNSHPPHENARKGLSRYILRFLGIDWGGGGDEMVSFTTAAVVGLLPDGRLDVLYGRRLFMPNDPIVEAGELMKIYNLFKCQAVCHDYNGAGSVHEGVMVQMGLPIDKVVPMVYYRSGNKDIMVFHGHEEEHHRKYYLLDKARSLATTCEMIKLERIRFFEDDYMDKDNPGLLRDFLSLFKHKVPTARAGEAYMIHSMASAPDDFAHSVNFACCGMWHATQRWPNLAQLAGLRLSAAQHAAFNPVDPWHNAT